MRAGCALTASAKAAGEGSEIFAHLRTGSGDPPQVCLIGAKA